MMKLIVSIALLAGMCLSSCSDTATIKHRVTVFVDDGQAVQKGSGVWWIQVWPSWPATSFDARFSGEAIPIRSPRQGTVYAIIASVSDTGDPQAAYMQHLTKQVFRKKAMERLRSKRSTLDEMSILHEIARMKGSVGKVDCKFEPDYCPMIVSFRDRNDPSTVTSRSKRDPNSTKPLLVTHVQVEIVDDDVTQGIEEHLPSLATHKEGFLDRTLVSSGRTLASKLEVMQFSTELGR